LIKKSKWALYLWLEKGGEVVMEDFFKQAVSNVISHGDTDISPFPIENHIFFDSKDAVVDLLVKLNGSFYDSIVKEPPANDSALTPVGYEGFRWATQLDPLWNAYFLGVVLSVIPPFLTLVKSREFLSS